MFLSPPSSATPRHRDMCVTSDKGVSETVPEPNTSSGRPPGPKTTAGLPYRPGVGIMLLNRDHNVFVAHRLDNLSEAWQMPQGGVEDGETPTVAAFRELKEEIGTNNAEIIDEIDAWLTYDFPVELIPKLWQGRYQGQKQKWFAMRFLGTDSEINLETEKPEFRAWKWVPRDRVADLIVPFKKQLYQRVMAHFSALTPPS